MKTVLWKCIALLSLLLVPLFAEEGPGSPALGTSKEKPSFLWYQPKTELGKAAWDAILRGGDTPEARVISHYKHVVLERLLQAAYEQVGEDHPEELALATQAIETYAHYYATRYRPEQNAAVIRYFRGEFGNPNGRLERLVQLNTNLRKSDHEVPEPMRSSLNGTVPLTHRERIEREIKGKTREERRRYLLQPKVVEAAFANFEPPETEEPADEESLSLEQEWNDLRDRLHALPAAEEKLRSFQIGRLLSLAEDFDPSEQEYYDLRVAAVVLWARRYATVLTHEELRNSERLFIHDLFQKPGNLLLAVIMLGAASQWEQAPEKLDESQTKQMKELVQVLDRIAKTGVIPEGALNHLEN